MSANEGQQRWNSDPNSDEKVNPEEEAFWASLSKPARVRRYDPNGAAFKRAVERLSGGGRAFTPPRPRRPQDAPKPNGRVSPGARTTIEQTRLVECPKCKAPKGAPCDRPKDYKRLTNGSHVERHTAALESGAVRAMRNFTFVPRGERRAAPGAE